MAQSSKLLAYLLLPILFASCLSAYAESRDPADYPLRFHIFTREEHNHYHHGVQDDARGEGRANLFANSDVHGVDFNFDCSHRVETSVGYETYMAKWKKPGKQLVVLLPVMGKTGAYEACNFDVDVKEIAYYGRNREILTESPGDFKAWMVAHNYDPEHGKNEPSGTESRSTPQLPPPPSQ